MVSDRSEGTPMLSINLEPKLEKHFTELARRNGRSVDYFAHKAIERMIEDLEDIAAAEEVLRDYDPSQNVSLEELRRELGLDA
jgi:predicted DNA-binding protein